MNSHQELKFDDRGLIPTVVQDVNTLKVLMVAWMNKESLRPTQEHGEVVFFSRSRQALWHKGLGSGEVLRVREIYADCDEDTLLILADPRGPVCHTGEESCFFLCLDDRLTEYHIQLASESDIFRGSLSRS